MFVPNSIKHMGGCGSLMTSEPECLMTEEIVPKILF